MPVTIDVSERDWARDIKRFLEEAFVELNAVTQWHTEFAELLANKFVEIWPVSVVHIATDSPRFTMADDPVSLVHLGRVVL